MPDMDVEKLLTPRANTPSGMPEDDVDIKDMGTVRVRGLSRDEVFETQEAKTTQASERKILAIGMVDPSMTEAQAGRWQIASPAGEIEPVVDKIRELSGLNDGAEKEAVLSFRDEPGDGVRVLPGDEAGADGGQDALGDAER